MRKITPILLIVVVLIGAGIVVLPSLIPDDVYRNQVSSLVHKATGRTLSIEGELSLSVFPKLELEVADVTLSNAEWSSEPTMAEIKRLRVGLELLPLLGRKVKVSEFILEDPTIYLEVAKDGRQNWDFLTSSEPGASAETAEAGDAATVTDVSLGDVQLINGGLKYTDHQSDSQYDVSDVNLMLTLPSLGSPFAAKGAMVYNAGLLKLDLEIENPLALSKNEATPFSFALASDLVKVNIDGTLSSSSPVKAVGKSNVDIPSLRKFAAWIGSPIEAESGFENLSVRGELAIDGDTYAFSKAHLKFDDIEGTGDVALDLGRRIPKASGRLSVPVLDFRPYVLEDPEEIDDFLPWDTTSIDFSGLKVLDADFTFAADQILYDKFELGKSALRLQINDGLVQADLTDLNLYQGTGVGSLRLDASKAMPRLVADFNLTNIAAGPLIMAALDRKVVEGTGDISFSVSSRGRSQKEMMDNLGGDGRLLLNDGEIVGADIAAMLTLIQTFKPKPNAVETEGEEQIEGEAGEKKSTKFVEMGGTFAIIGGVLDSQDFRLVNEALSLSGKGNIDLAEQTINFRVNPGLRNDDGGLKVALKITGGWNNIKFRPDIKQMLENRLGKELKKKLNIDIKDPVGSLLNSFFKTPKSKDPEPQN